MEWSEAELHRVSKGAISLGRTLRYGLRAYPGLRDDRNLRGWLLRIAARKVIDHHRATRRRPLPVETVPERGAEPAAMAG